jgi:hypothetical protein
MGERRGNWMEVVQEFDLDIKPAKLVKGQGLCKLAAEAQDQVNEDLYGKMKWHYGVVKLRTFPQGKSLGMRN